MQQRKKFTSYSRYFAYLTGKIALESAWIGLLLGFVLCFVAMLLSGLFALLSVLFIAHNFWSPMNFCWFILPFVFGFGGWVMFCIATAASRRSDAMQPLILPTRVNIEQLPAEEVLLRMAQEPSTPQEQILLRPAGASDVTPQTELLRPSAPSLTKPHYYPGNNP